MSGPRRIDPVFVDRVWGRTNLAPLFGSFDRRIGEVWFPVSEAFPLLLKFIFTDERLSVQVHPNDEYAREHENSRGKTEMWHILAAEPGATIALGFERPLEPDQLRRSIEDGSVVDLLRWVPVKAGDTLFAPAGVVHAIGGGIALCEIQENSDVTYRLFDYGRPRELHLEPGLAVSDPNPYDGRRELPVVCEHFSTELVDGASAGVRSASEHLLVAIEGRGTLDGEAFEAGSVWLIPEGCTPHIESGALLKFLRTRPGRADV